MFVIFGASGDLTRRKLFPALYALAYRKMLPERFAVLGSARSPMTSEEFRAAMEEAVREHARVEFKQEVWDELVQSTYYVSMEFDDEHAENRVAEKLTELDREHGTEGNRLYYLAVPPGAIATLVREIGERRSSEGWARLIVEKPFGFDLASAQRLNHEILRHFHENEIFRIDHYLGKETVQNMLALRFANGIFEPLWTRQYVDHVQITVAESIGIEGRAAFYEKLGASRDVFQNHMLQLVAITAMEPPIDFDADAVRNEKAKVLRATEVDAVVHGQYGPGYVEGKMVPGYREETGVDPESTAETYVAAKIRIDTWRWADTPFYVRTGKRLPRRETTIAIQFKRVPQSLFTHADGLRPNVLAIHVQPDEGVSLGIGAKVPGQGMTVRTVNMDFLYGGAFRTGLPEAYERLILDAMRGDPTLFTRADEIEEQWRIVDSFRTRWEDQVPDFPNYDAGTWGPDDADELLHRDSRSWRRH